MVQKGADFAHSSKRVPETEGTKGCWADLGHSGKESARQRELKAAGLTWGTVARRAQDRGN